VEQPVIVSK